MTRNVRYKLNTSDSEAPFIDVANFRLVSSFLNDRRYANPNNDNIAEYYGRQVARFLCDFWSPDLH